jgi:hypothetical protein
MRAGVLGVLGLVVVLIVALGAGAAAREVAACPTSLGMADASKPNKASSFQPRPRPAHNAYGAPVGSKILTHRVKPKQPELHSTPLPSA